MALEEGLGEAAAAAAAIEECGEAEDGVDSLVWALPSGYIQAYGLEVVETEVQVIPVAPAQSGRSGIFVAQPKADIVNESPSVSVLTQSVVGVLSKQKLALVLVELAQEERGRPTEWNGDLEGYPIDDQRPLHVGRLLPRLTELKRIRPTGTIAKWIQELGTHGMTISPRAWSRRW